MGCRRIESAREALFSKLSETVCQRVTDDPGLTAYLDTDPPEEFELLPTDVEPATFDFERHERRITDFLVNAIRSFAFDRHHVLVVVDRKKKKRKKGLDKLVEDRYRSLVKMVAHSDGVEKLLRLKEKRKESKRLQSIVDKMRWEREEDLAEKRVGLQEEAAKVVTEWLRHFTGSEMEQAVQFAAKTVERQIRKAESARRGEKKRLAQIEEADEEARAARRRNVTASMRLSRRVDSWRNSGKMEYVAVAMYNKWSKKKRLKAVRRCTDVCKNCEDRNKEVWKQEGSAGAGLYGELTLEDAMAFHHRLYDSGEMGALVEYLAILLRKYLRSSDQLLQ